MKRNSTENIEVLEKSPTGISGLDEITYGGFPKGRTTLVCGAAGSGKTLLAMEFLMRGALQFDEPGAFISFEETENELAVNISSLGFDLKDLVKKKKIFLDFIHIEKSEIEETGEYDLEGLFIRLQYAIDSVGAKRVVLDTIESLFSGFMNEFILRAELRRLFRWLKDKGVTAVITGERGTTTLTRQGLEEYVSDCVIVLDHRVSEQISTRRMRIVKYRGSVHGTNEYPFLIDNTGISVLPITSLGLGHDVSPERISSGVPELDKMLEGKGYYKGSSILVSGTAGTGKSSLAAHLAEAACKRGEKVLYVSLEESPAQITRNMNSIGISLEKWVKKGLLMFHSTRPSFTGMEMHLAVIHKMVSEFEPSVLIVDPLNSFADGSNLPETRSLSMRLIDYLKSSLITAFFTNLAGGNENPEETEISISSVIDTWILIRDIETDGKREKGIYILKSRGMAHSNEIRNLVITSKGILIREMISDLKKSGNGQEKVHKSRKKH